MPNSSSIRRDRVTSSRIALNAQGLQVSSTLPNARADISSTLRDGRTIPYLVADNRVYRFITNAPQKDVDFKHDGSVTYSFHMAGKDHVRLHRNALVGPTIPDVNGNPVKGSVGIYVLDQKSTSMRPSVQKAAPLFSVLER